MPTPFERNLNGLGFLQSLVWSASDLDITRTNLAIKLKFCMRTVLQENPPTQCWFGVSKRSFLGKKILHAHFELQILSGHFLNEAKIN